MGERHAGRALAAGLALGVASQGVAQPIDLVPARCVAGAPTPQSEESLGTVTQAPAPTRRSGQAGPNLEHPHAESELLVFPTESGRDLEAQDQHWRRLFRSLGARVVRFAPQIPFYRVRFRPSTRLHDAVARLEALPQVRAVRANSCVFAAQESPTNEPEFGAQWALEKIRMMEAWEVEKGDDGLVVAVIDSGFTPTNPDLGPRTWLNPCETVDEQDNPCEGEETDELPDDMHGWNFLENNNVLSDGLGHGTMISGIIAAVPTNGLLIAGINYDVRLMHLKIYDNQIGYYDGVLLAFDYAIRHGAKVINVSWVMGGFNPELKAKLAEAAEQKIVVVAAAGQGGDGADLDDYSLYPCSFDLPNVVCVTSTTPADTLLLGSNFGKNAVHVGAPGASIRSTLGSSTGTDSGTSLAAPQVTGVAALLRAQCPNASAAWVRGRIQSGPSVLGSATQQGKRLDAFEAVASGCPFFDPRRLLEWLHRLDPRRIKPWWKPRPHWPPPEPDPLHG